MLLYLKFSKYLGFLAHSKSVLKINFEFNEIELENNMALRVLYSETSLHANGTYCRITRHSKLLGYSFDKSTTSVLQIVSHTIERQHPGVAPIFFMN